MPATAPEKTAPSPSEPPVRNLEFLIAVNMYFPGRLPFLDQGIIRAEKFATAPNIVQGKRLGLSQGDLQYFIDYYKYWRQ
jgi:hypothetical protein